jgi:spermidine/putrescine transport system substrate-binding protein
MNATKTLLAAALWLLASGPALAAEKVYVYNWTEYIPQEVIDGFTKETGIEVIYSTYDSNETMYAKVKLAPKDGYDVVVPSTYFVSKMSRENLLQPLDHALLPNMRDLDAKMLDKPFDRGNVYSIPYMWGSTGIGINAKFIDAATITSWKDLWNPLYKGKVLLQDDVREVFHMALKLQGKSSNTTDAGDIEAAYVLLKELMPNVLLFNSDSPRLPYLAGEVNIGMIWNGEAWMAAQENPDIRYIYPKEGANLWVDSFVIPKGARNVKNSHAFINYMLKAEVAKQCVEQNGYATPVLSALPLLDEKVRTSPTVFAPPEIVAAGEFQLDVGDALPVYQKYWELLRAGN